LKFIPSTGHKDGEPSRNFNKNISYSITTEVREQILQIWNFEIVIGGTSRKVVEPSIRFHKNSSNSTITQVREKISQIWNPENF